tara:strand:- start:30448 stop:30903 length:456 start_codon:yes stop_codon:yes gene_type:complete
VSLTGDQSRLPQSWGGVVQQTYNEDTTSTWEDDGFSTNPFNESGIGDSAFVAPKWNQHEKLEDGLEKLSEYYEASEKYGSSALLFNAFYNSMDKELDEGNEFDFDAENLSLQYKPNKEFKNISNLKFNLSPDYITEDNVPKGIKLEGSFNF